MQRKAWLIVLPALFIAYSLPIFLRVYATTQSVIDEQFHLRQGLHYCNKRLDIWDRKITTFPGLYFAALLLTPFNFCTVLGLRLISFVAAIINVILLFRIRTRVYTTCFKLPPNFSQTALDVLTVSALPPLYFFTHLYYTDMLALTTVLCFYDQWLQKKHLNAAVYAAGSVLMRQTNVVWVGMLCGVTALDILEENYAKKRQVPVDKVSLISLKAWGEILTTRRLLWTSYWQIMRRCVYYLIIIMPFVAFVFINGSVVLGDKAAHKVSLHIPQLFYFALFTCFFAVSNTLQQMRNALRLLLSERLITLFCVGVCILIVKWNTLEHPYLLADNRHYIFYIWTRFYVRLPWFRYAIVPVYVLAATIIYSGMSHLRPNFRLMFAVALFLSLCFQKLLELRYFIIPCIFIRLHIVPRTRDQWPKWQYAPQWIELAQNIIINAFTFYTFFNKEVIWADFKEPQRIIW